MGLIRKISNTDEFREKLTEAQLLKMDLLDKELSATSELVKLGNE